MATVRSKEDTKVTTSPRLQLKLTEVWIRTRDVPDTVFTTSILILVPFVVSTFVIVPIIELSVLSIPLTLDLNEEV